LAKIEIYYLILGSVGFDLLTGDPEFLIHPVQIIGFYIKKLSDFSVKLSQRKDFLNIAGLFITITTIFFSYFIGKFIEINYFQSNSKIFWGVINLLGISSCIASKNLLSSAKEIAIYYQSHSEIENKKDLLREKVQRLVSRDVSTCSMDTLLRSTTESLTENSVDGIFGPLFWIFIGGILINFSFYLPGPLSLGFAYKASSTLDSMIGYKHFPLNHLGFFSAKCEDYASYLPARLLLFTLPLIKKNQYSYKYLIKKAFYEGGKYESPNAGISQAIFALILNINLGGENKYRNKVIIKPKLNPQGSNCDVQSIHKICNLILMLKLLWVALFTLIMMII
tara:strand:- start:1668 stop:2678 length:1011 start_codon:yes stop_codon:yes gene_type:complete